MPQTECVFIIGGDEPIVLHPFDLPRFVAGAAGELAGRCSSGFVARGADSLRQSLYLSMERSLRRRIVDKGYAPRLVASAALFIGVYLFCSLVIRDPIPLVDEVLLGAIAAGLLYFGWERRALSSPRHVEALVRARKSIDSLFFTESRVLDLVEAWRDELLLSGPASFHRPSKSEPVLSPDERLEAEALCELLAARWKKEPIVASLYEASLGDKMPGALIDKAFKRLGRTECALALAYVRLIPLALSVQD